MRARLLRAAVCVLVTCAAIEVSVRVFFAVGLNDPALLLYPGASAAPDEDRAGGTDPIGSVYPDVVMPGYRKYAPNPRKKIYVGGDHRTRTEPYDAHINRRGYRGPEIQEPKAAGVTRVVCLGESSTFGAFVRDDQTYPAQLAHILRERAPARAYEVINLGVSEFTTGWLGPMLEREVLRLEPDIVAFLGGHNDIRDYINPNLAAPLDPPDADDRGGMGRYSPRTGERKSSSLFVEFAKDLIRQRIWPDDRVRSAAAEVWPGFRDNLTRLARQLRRRNIRLLVIKQKISPPNPSLENLSYAEFHRRIAARLSAGEQLDDIASAVAWGHYPLMQRLEQLAEEGAEVVDAVVALDGHGDDFASHVHLGAGGNFILASVLARAITQWRPPPLPPANRPSDFPRP